MTFSFRFIQPLAPALALAAATATVSTAPADVFDMGGTRNADGSWSGLASLETVQVGQAGNAADVDTGYGSVGYDYRISKFEITLGQYTAFLNAVAASDTYGLYSTTHGFRGVERQGSDGGYTYTVDESWANRPVNDVDWADAARFANWLHNGQPTGAQDLSTTEDGSYLLNGAASDEAISAAAVRRPGATWVLPTDDEWYKAAYYDPTTGDYYRYPMSSDSRPSNDLINPDPGNHANFFYYIDEMTGDWTLPYNGGDPREFHTTVVGEFENSASPPGARSTRAAISGNGWRPANPDSVIFVFAAVRGTTPLPGVPTGTPWTRVTMSMPPTATERWVFVSCRCRSRARRECWLRGC